MGNIIVTVILVATGVSLIVNAYHLNHHVLFLGWVEQKWGPGSGTLAYKAIGLALIVLATLIITGVINVFEDPLDRINRSQGAGNTSNTQNTPIRNNPAPVNLSY